MAPPSSGGSTVGEALNILENVDLGAIYGRTQALHDYLEASALAFADRGEVRRRPVAMQPGVLGAAALAGVRGRALLHARPDQGGDQAGARGHAGRHLRHELRRRRPTAPRAADHEGLSTTHLTDRRPVGQHRDLHADHRADRRQRAHRARAAASCSTTSSPTSTSRRPSPDDAERTRRRASGRAARCRRRSSTRRTAGRCSPPGSPGGSTIITTVLQMLINRLDFGMTLPQAIAAPRASQRNTADVQAEPAFDRDRALTALRPHVRRPARAPGEIGAVDRHRVPPGGRLVAAAEPVRRGGGDARVVHPR